MLRAALIISAVVLTSLTAVSAQSTLLITEFTVTPTAGEMVEFYNPGPDPVDLTDYYISDATFAGGGTYYYNIVIGAPGGGAFGDFSARFPANTSIDPAEYQTVAFADAGGALGFFATYGVMPTYECLDGVNNDPIVLDMREAVPGSINGGGGLTNSGEFLVMFQWDGASDLVADIDYVMWGDAAEAVDKTGVIIDGPDADAVPSAYLNDTPIPSQAFMTPPGLGTSAQRVMMSEGLETTLGGNGLYGNDETSENLASTWANAGHTAWENAGYTPNARTAAAVDYAWTNNNDGTYQIDVSGGVPGGALLALFALSGATIPVGQFPGDGLSVALGGGTLIAVASFDGLGELHQSAAVTAGLGTIHMQIIDVSGAKITNTVVATF